MIFSRCGVIAAPACDRRRFGNPSNALRGFDSGYESRRRKSPELPQGTVEKRDFKFQAELAFITYSKSRINDKMEFFDSFRKTIEPHLPRVSADGTATVEIFSSRELHEDGVTPHYHVVARFLPRVH
ncbi:hypothetical protein HRG_014895 [Hirsutella rhossiliensis]